MPEKTKAHYIWIGKPQTKNLSDLKGDLKGPVAMAQQVDANTTLYFWCLEEHVIAYENLFAGKNIVVRSIEQYLEEKNENNYVQDIAKLKSLLFSDMRDSIRDRVTFKEAISYLILFLEGGYALDTNVLPANQEKIFFPHYPSFHATALHLPVVNNRHMDTWMMYSPPESPEHAETALKYFLREFGRIEMRREQEGYSFDYEKYKTAILDIVIESARSHVGLQYWTPRHLGGNYPVKLHVENPKIIKHYSNSHGATDRKEIPFFHLAVSKNDIAAVKDLFNRCEFDINAVDETEKYAGITALNIATFYGYTEMAALLIAKGADPEIKLQMCVSRTPSPGPFNPAFFPLSVDRPILSFEQESSSSESGASTQPPIPH